MRGRRHIALLFKALYLLISITAANLDASDASLWAIQVICWPQLRELAQ